MEQTLPHTIRLKIKFLASSYLLSRAGARKVYRSKAIINIEATLILRIMVHVEPRKVATERILANLCR
jgi:hypothetical protein